MNILKLMLLSTTALLSACATLGSFSSLDKDADGRISRQEAARSDDLASAFDYGDSNQDGYLSPHEYDNAKELLLSLREQRGSAPEGAGHSSDGHRH